MEGLIANNPDQNIRDLIINSKEPQVLVRNEDDGTFEWTSPSWGDRLAIDGSYMQKFWNVSMIKYEDIYSVKLA